MEMEFKEALNLSIDRAKNDILSVNIKDIDELKTMPVPPEVIFYFC